MHSLFPEECTPEMHVSKCRSTSTLGLRKTSLGYAAFVHGYQVPIHHVNHMKAGYAYAPMHDIQFSETITNKYYREQKL